MLDSREVPAYDPHPGERQSMPLAVFVACGAIIAFDGEILACVLLLVGSLLAILVLGDRVHLVVGRLFITASMLAAFHYFQYRVPLINWDNWVLGIALIVAELFALAQMLGFQFTLWPRRNPPLNRVADPTQLPIFILIPTLNEGRTILEPTLRGVIAAREAYLLRYPYAQVTITICNDGFVGRVAGWEAVERLADYYSVGCITREIGGGAKAGNIEHARLQMGITGQQLMVVFDADQIPEPDFLLQTVPHFADPSVAWVQTGQYYRNTENAVARWANEQQGLFYHLICPGKSAVNAAFICGTNFMLRAKALHEAGGFPVYSHTEDFAVSLPMHASGWRSVYLRDQLTTGLGPMDLKTYFAQQRRWAIGTLEVFRVNWPSILLPWASKLTIAQRIQYFLSGTHYLSGVRDLVFIAVPIIFLFTGQSAIADFSTGIVERFLFYWMVITVSAIYFSYRYTSFWHTRLMEYASFPSYLRSAHRILLDLKGSFEVSSKVQLGDRNINQLRWHFVMLAIIPPAIIVGLTLNTNPLSAIYINIFWLLYAVLQFSGVLWLAFADTVRTRQDSTKRLRKSPEM